MYFVTSEYYIKHCVAYAYSLLDPPLRESLN